MPGKYLQNEWMRYSSVWGTFKKGLCFFFLIVSQYVAKGWKAAWGCREEQEGYSGLRCHRKQPQCLSWPLLAEIRKNRLKHSLYLEAPLKTECLCPTPTPNSCWNPNPYVIVLRGRAFGRWLSHVGRVLGNEISAFIKKRDSTKVPHPSSIMRGHSRQKAFYELGIRPASNTTFSRALILGLPSFQHCEK